VRRIRYGQFVKPNQYTFLAWVIMRRNHHQHVELPNLRRFVDETRRTDAERDLLADFIINDIDEATYTSTLCKHDKKRRFNVEYIAIMETFCAVIHDMLTKLNETPPRVTEFVDRVRSQPEFIGTNETIDSPEIISIINEMEIAKIMVELETFFTYIIEQLTVLGNVYKLSTDVVQRDVKHMKESIRWIFNNWACDQKVIATMVPGTQNVNKNVRFVDYTPTVGRFIIKYIAEARPQDPWCWTRDPIEAIGKKRMWGFDSIKINFINWPPFADQRYVFPTASWHPRQAELRHTRGWDTIEDAMNRRNHARY